MPPTPKTKKGPSSVSPVGKKLVQARLPFKTVTPTAKAPLVLPATTPTSALAEPTRKRKLSAALADNNRPSKVNKVDVDAKENVQSVIELIDSDEDCSKNNVVCIPSGEPDKPNTPAKKASTRQVATPQNGSAKKTPKTKKNPTPKMNTPKSSSKRKASSSPVVVVLEQSDDDEPQETKPASFSIKIPISKKQSSVADKTPTRAKRGKRVLDTSATKDASQSDSPVKPKKSTPKKSTTPQKSPVKAASPVSAKKTPSSTPKASPTPSKKTPFAMSRQSRSKSVLNKDTPTIALSDEDGSSVAKANGLENSIDDNTNSSAGAMDTSITESRLSEFVEKETTTATPKKPQTTPSASKLTPKQLLRKQDAENRLKEKVRLKEERDRKAAEEQEKKREQKRIEQEDREKKRLEEIEAKNEDRKRKEEQREEERKRKEEQREEDRKKREELKEEERKKKEDEKMAKEVADKQKNQKEAAAFTKFFVKHSTKPIAVAAVIESKEIECRQNFMPFRVKEDMKLAPMVRRVFSDNNRRDFDAKVLSAKSPAKKIDLYVNQLKSGLVKRGSGTKTWITDGTEVQIVDDELEGAAAIIDEPKSKQKFRAKLFKFHENRRPAYYGTWRKTSTSITPRKPFVTDSTFFDYEVDSDDEWEEEEPGESLHGSDDEKDKESDDEYDIDNEFFVPHGHLSDEEVMADDDEEADHEDNSPETQKAKLKIVQMEFADEMRKKTQKIKPRLIGLIWQQPNGSLPASCANVIADMLRSRAMVFQGAAIKLQKESRIENGGGDANDDVKATTSKRQVLSDSLVADLIRLIHGNIIGRASLVLEFQHFLRQKDMTFSNAGLCSRIRELASYQSCPDEGELLGKNCWYVSQEIRQQYGLAELSTPNTWTYSLDNLKARQAEAQKSQKKVKQVVTPATAAVDEPKPTKSKFNISNFTKLLSDEDKQKQFKKAETPTPTKLPPAKPTPVSTTTNTAAVVKKRVSLLMSVPRGQPIPTNAKNALISNFLNNPTQSADATADQQQPKPVEMIEID